MIMMRKLWRSFVGSVKWVLWVVALAFVLNVIALGALIVTPVMFFLFWKAHSTAEVFVEVMEKVTAKIIEEAQKSDKFEMFNDVEFEMEIDDEEDDDLFKV